MLCLQRQAKHSPVKEDMTRETGGGPTSAPRVHTSITMHACAFIYDACVCFYICLFTGGSSVFLFGNPKATMASDTPSLISSLNDATSEVAWTLGEWNGEKLWNTKLNGVPYVAWCCPEDDTYVVYYLSNTVDHGSPDPCRKALP